MKVGLILECGPAGAETKVLPVLFSMLPGGHEIDSVTMGNKPALVGGCGKAAAGLLSGGCDKVFIFWDLYPAWRESSPCRKQDCENIRDSLLKENVPLKEVVLVCIEQELEAWLIADGRALRDFLSSAAHKTKNIRDEKSPDQVENPKAVLSRLFQKHGRGRYNDLIHAERIARKLPDLSRVRRSVSFARFAGKVEELA